MSRIALFGGSFDPPTIGHAATARNVLKSGLVDQLRFVPVGTDRYDRPLVASAEQRRAMVELFVAEAFPNDPRVAIESAQLDGRLPGSATIDLVEYLKLREPANTFCFVIGGDNIKKVGEWRDYAKLIQAIRFLAVPRMGEPIPQDIPSAVTVIEGGELSGASSSAVRQLLSLGESPAGLLTPNVAAFIRASNLYRSGALPVEGVSRPAK